MSKLPWTVDEILADLQKMQHFATSMESLESSLEQMESLIHAMQKIVSGMSTQLKREN